MILEIPTREIEFPWIGSELIVDFHNFAKTHPEGVPGYVTHHRSAGTL